jgi:hypothetical protein
MMRKLLLSFAVVVGLVTAGVLAIGNPISAVEKGMAQGVDPDAAAIDGGATRSLHVGDDVKVGETVETGPTGQVQLLFDDSSELVIGPNSRLRIDDYFIRNDGSAGKFAVAALQGTFRFVTGTAPHDAYTITTPTGTIGVRGTAFDFSVLRQAIEDYIQTSEWVVTLLVFDGAVQLCNLQNVCVLIDAVCGFGVMSDLDALAIENNRAARDTFRDDLPYASDQSPLERLFWVANARQCIAPGPGADNVPGTLSNAGGSAAPPAPPTVVPVTPVTTSSSTPPS